MACPDSANHAPPPLPPADEALLLQRAMLPGAPIRDVVLAVATAYGYSLTYLRGRASWLRMYEDERGTR